MEETELKNYLINFVLEFCSKMNELEREIVEKAESNPGKDYFPEYRNRYLPIFEEYCSDKKRVYAGKADSYGEPTQYDGIENSIEQNTELKTKSRAEVYFKTQNSFDAEYLFVVLRKNNEWRVDSFKLRWFGNEKWDSGIL